MTKKIKRRIVRLMIIVTMTLCAIYTSKFLIVTWNYNEISSEISSVVESAEKNGWNLYHTSWYNKYSEKREELVKNNDIARFLFYSGYSKTGQIIRATVFLVACIYLVFYVIFAICYFKYLIKYFSNNY